MTLKAYLGLDTTKVHPCNKESNVPKTKLNKNQTENKERSIKISNTLYFLSQPLIPSETPVQLPSPPLPSFLGRTFFLIPHEPLLHPIILI